MTPGDSLLLSDPAPATTAAPVISVVIPHLNTPDLLARCLESLMVQQLDAGPFEVIVVDNGSRTPLDAVQQRFAGVRFLLQPAAGPGLARNMGAAAARAPLLAFIDADCIALPGWVQAAHAAAASGAVVGGDIGVEVVDAAGMTGCEAFESEFGFRQKFYIETRKFSVTANMAMPASALARVGPFAGIEIAEDLDWGQRAHAQGQSISFLPAMRVLHPARPDFAALARKWDRLLQHEWNGHRASGRSIMHWWLRTAMVALSPFLDARRMILSDRVSGLGNRWRGLVTLVRIRWYRVAKMLVAGRALTGPQRWNR